MAHRVVAIAWIPKIEGKDFVNHKNGIKTDNRIENLEWCTHEENIRHSVTTGLRHEANGEGHYRSRLTKKDAMEIFHAIGTLSEIGKKYGVTFQVVSRIKHKQAWKCLWRPAA